VAVIFVAGFICYKYALYAMDGYGNMYFLNMILKKIWPASV